jgi:uroporphyrinogen-III synthase
MSGLLKSVLITRPEPGASQTADRVRQLGFDPVIASVLEVDRKGRLSAAPVNWVASILTSQNAILSVPLAHRTKPAFTVGQATATLASSAGFQNIISGDADATALVPLIAEHVSPAEGSLFFPTGRFRGKALADALRERGYRVIRRVAYQAVPVRALPQAALTRLRHRQLDVAMFFSTETASHFVRLVRQTGLEESVEDVEAVSISEGAAVALRHLKWRAVTVAPKPNQEAMLALLK